MGKRILEGYQPTGDGIYNPRPPKGGTGEMDPVALTNIKYVQKIVDVMDRRGFLNKKDFNKEIILLEVYKEVKK